MFKYKFNSAVGGTNRSRKLAILLLSSFVSLSPVTTIIACNKKDQVDDGSDNNRTMKLLDQIKIEINKEFEQKASSILDYNSFVGLSKEQLFKILDDYHKEMVTSDRVEVNNQLISQYFINKINEKLTLLNAKLKSHITQLSNLSFDIVSIGASNLFLEKLNYTQILEVIKNLGQDTTYTYNNPNPKVFKLKFNLSFKIKIDDIREEEYVFPELQHFITDNIQDISGKLSVISNSLYSKLKESKISLEKLITEQGELNGNLNQKLIEAIKSNFSNKNSGLNLKFDKLSTTFKEEDLKINLKSLKHTNSDGVTANDQRIQYYQNFINVTLTSNLNMIEALYTNNDDLKEINDGNVPGSGEANIKAFEYTPLNLSVSGINIPMVTPIKTYITSEYVTYVKYLEQFRTFLQEYFTLIKAGKLESIDGASRKVVTVQRSSMHPTWANETVRALDNDFKRVIFDKMKNSNKQYFKIIFPFKTGWGRNLDLGTHASNVTVRFLFKIFSINFLDDEQIRFIYP